MLSTVASIFTGALLVAAPFVNNPSTEGGKEIAKTEESTTLNQVSHAVSVNSSFEALDEIKAEAEAAGLGFTYKKRGVKTRLVIDMVIETAEDYTLERMVLRAEDGTKYIEWTENEAGEAVAIKSAEF